MSSHALHDRNGNGDSTAVLIHDEARCLDQEVAAQILEAYRAAEELALQATSSANNAIEQALRVGAMLNSKKQQVGAGNWSRWLRTYCPAVAVVTAARWMKLARLKANGLGQCLEGQKSLTAAYISVGILPATAVASHRRAKQFRQIQHDADFLQLLNKLYAEKAAEAMLALTDRDLLDWKPIDLELFEHELEPLVLLHERIKKALQGRLA